MNTGCNRIITTSLMIIAVLAMAGWQKIAEGKSPYRSKNIRVIK